MISHIAKRLWELPPKEVFRRVGNRFSNSRGFDAGELLESSKHMRVQRFYDFISRYETIISQARDWQPLDYENKTVLEIGCGPLLGFGPIAIFNGADEFIAVEPMYDIKILQDPRFVDNYFWGVFADLSALYGPQMNFDEFMERLRTRTNWLSCNIGQIDIERKVDIVLTNSCLEHISPFVESMAALQRVCVPSCRSVHLVDFGNHKSANNPFEGIYSMDRDRYLETNGTEINLYKPSDILSGLEQAGFEAAFVPYILAKNEWIVPVHDYWAQKYSQDELFTKTGIFCSR